MKLFINIAIIFSALFIYAEPAHASDLVLVPKICDSDDIIKPNRISGNVVRCVEFIVSDRGDELIDKYISEFSYIVFHVIVLAIIIFFMRVMYGVARARGVISLFAAKVLLVLMIVNPENTPEIKEWRDALINFPKDISMEILSAVESPINKDVDSGIETEDVFDQLDVYIIRMFGVDESTLSDNSAEQKEVYLGIAAMVAGLFFTGSVGVAVAAITVGFVIAVLMAAAQAVLFFCTIIIALNFLAAIAPITVTCILFQPTKRITTLWFQYLLIYIIQPILLMAFLGLTLGMIDGVISNFDDPHDKILGKWENKDQNKRYEVTLFDCSNMSIPTDSMFQMFKNSDMMGSIASQATFSNKDFDRYSMGYGNIGSEVNFSADALNFNFGSNCEIKVPSLSLDFDESTFNNPDDSVQLSRDDMREFMGLKLGITILMIMLISFMMKLPEKINYMVGQGVIAELARYAVSPVQKGQQMLYGSGDKGGVFANSLSNLNSQYSKRMSNFK